MIVDILRGENRYARLLSPCPSIELSSSAHLQGGNASFISQLHKLNTELIVFELFHSPVWSIQLGECVDLSSCFEDCCAASSLDYRLQKTLGFKMEDTV